MMQIKRFEGQTMSEALRMVKKEFGPDAVILSAKNVKRDKGVLGLTRKPRVEVTAATDRSQGSGVNKESFHRPWNWEGAQSEIAVVQEIGAKRKLFSSLQGEVKGLRQKLNTLGKRKEKKQPDTKGLFDLYQQLVTEGVSESLATQLVEKLDAFSAAQDSLTREEISLYLSRILTREGVTLNAIDVEKGSQKIVAFVGPTGVGKTTAVAKLAATHALEMRKHVGFITMDHSRIGGMEQLKVCGEIMGIPLLKASNANELKKSVRKLEKCDLVLVDTAGVSCKSRAPIDELRGFLKGVPSAEVFLTLSATTKESDLAEIIDAFSSLRLSALLFTKLDETTTYGALLNQHLRTKVPLSYFSAHQQIPEGIEIATLEKLVALIIDTHVEKGTRSWFSKTLKKKEAESDTMDTTQIHYIGKKNSGIYHFPWCKQAKKIKKENTIIYEDRQQLEDRDLRPCKLCSSESYMPDTIAVETAGEAMSCAYY